MDQRASNVVGAWSVDHNPKNAELPWELVHRPLGPGERFVHGKFAEREHAEVAARALNAHFA